MMSSVAAGRCLMRGASAAALTKNRPLVRPRGVMQPCSLSSSLHIAFNQILHRQQRQASRLGAAAAAFASAAFLFASCCGRHEPNTMTEGSRSSQRDSPAADIADLGYLSSSYFEPGTVEEIQHSLAQCLGYRLADLNMFGSERPMWEVLMDTIGNIVDIDGSAMSGVAYKDKQRHEERNMDEHAVAVNAEFPSLAVHIIDEESGKKNAFELNSPTGIPIENDFFVGRVLVHVKPLKQHSNESSNFGEERERFELKIQGRFKTQPKGEIYCGAELADSNGLRFGPVTRGLGTLLLNLLSRYVGPGITYSFGAGKKEELPHISFPLRTAMKLIHVTPLESVPPPIGQPFVESEESKSHRNSSSVSDSKQDVWDMNSIYSMSFSSSCVDLPSWQALYPRQIDLTTFWSDSALRLVVYESRGADEAVETTARQEKKYLLSLQLKFLGLEPNAEQNFRGKETENSQIFNEDEGDRRIIGGSSA